MNPYTRRKSGDTMGHGNKAEVRASKRLEMQLRPASGAMEGAKGDMSTEDVLLECKATQSDSYRVTREVLAKITREATEVGKIPALEINFTTGDGRPRENGSWVLIREKDFKKCL